ncbi:MAG: response regulator, partial [Desulfatiglandales bacterium]
PMSIKVLLIDDELKFVSTLSERLEIRGYTSKFSISGEEGLEQIASFSPDVVISDVIMPGLSGFDVLKALRKIAPTVPVILLTGHSSTQDGMKGMELGAFDYIIKPVDIEELVEKINLSLKVKK